MLSDHDEGALHVLERRIGAVAAVRQVLNAIWALARAQLPQVEAAAGEVAAYLSEVDAVVDRLAGAPRMPAPGARTLTVAFGPERAWCGVLPRHLLAQLPDAGEVGLVGARFAEVAKGSASVRERLRFALPGATGPDDAAAVARTVAEAILGHLDVGRVELLHPVEGAPRFARVLLIGGERERRAAAPVTLSPWADVLRAAVFEAVTSRLAVAAVEALRVEARARVVAAERARRAADQRLEELRRVWRVARQEAITVELLELVAGQQASLPLR